MLHLPSVLALLAETYGKTGQAVGADVKVAFSNSFGLGGHNACIMLRGYVPVQAIYA
jgi:3-oxoacyl-(acyl-carrier-protein) synthase